MIEILSGPEIILRSDQPQACRFCSLALPEPLETLIHHYTRVHGFIVVADYVDGVRYVELDKNGHCSERAKKILQK